MKPLRCPSCQASLTSNKHDISCSSCTFTATIEGDSYLFSKVSPNYQRENHLFEINRISDNDRYQWYKIIRDAFSLRPDKHWLNRVISQGNIAHKLFLEPLESAVIIDISGDAGNTAQQLVRTTKQSTIFSIETDPNNFKLSKIRKKSFYKDAPVTLILTDNGPILPFDDCSVDAIFSHNIEQFIRFPKNRSKASTIKQKLLSEMARVLKPNGQALLVENNLLSYEGFTNKKFTGSLKCSNVKLLKNAGFTDITTSNIVDTAGQLSNIIPSEGELFNILKEGKSVKERIKNNSALSPSFSYIATKTKKPNKCLIHQIHEEIQRNVSPSSQTPLKFSNIRVNGKYKAIAYAETKDGSFVVKIPHTDSGLQGENCNSVMLVKLSSHDNFTFYIPKSICNGKANEAFYFVESKCPGSPLLRVLAKNNRDKYAQEVFKTWEELLNCPQEGRLLTIDKLLIDKLIAKPKKILTSVVTEHKNIDLLCEYLSDQLLGTIVYFGLHHGDFSVANTFVGNGKVSGLIDWEYGSFSHPSILDLLNIYASMERAVTSNQDLYDNLESFLNKRWGNQLEWELLMEGFRLCHIDTAKNNAWFLLHWLHSIAHQLDTRLVYNTTAIELRIEKPLISICSWINEHE